MTDEKQGPAIFLTLERKARETVLNFDIKEIKAKNGIENIVQALNKLYVKDKLQMAYETYDAFDKFGRPEKMSIKEYINEFECLLNKIKKYGSSMSSDILASRQLIRATVKELTYDAMQLSLRRFSVTKTLTRQKQVVLMSKWNLTHSMEKLMMLLKMCITKGINLRKEDTTTTTTTTTKTATTITTTTTTTEEDLTEVEEEAEATEEEFRKDTSIQLILMVTFPDVEFVNPSIIEKTIALITLTKSPKVIQKKQCFTNPCFILKNSCDNLLKRH